MVYELVWIIGYLVGAENEFGVLISVGVVMDALVGHLLGGSLEILLVTPVGSSLGN